MLGAHMHAQQHASIQSMLQISARLQATGQVHGASNPYCNLRPNKAKFALVHRCLCRRLQPQSMLRRMHGASRVFPQCACSRS